ncbi:MAG TPA: GAF domain-containing protein, partial [Anaerolineae bacterium]|nr:GAF domain-containing protein [Anaerolineae bacterium]
SGPRMVVIITVMTLLTTGYIESLGRNGLLPEPLTPYNPVTDAIGTTSNLIFMAVIMYVTMKALNKTMALQRESNEALRQAQTTLEERVAERTRNLELAAEIGRRLVQVRDLDVLLAEAVELIRDDFDLYYVQIYLTDRAQRSLILSAGSGAVGRDLVRRGHRLAIEPGSINGMTAAQRQVIVVSDTAVSPLFKSNPYLPDTRSEMSIPLLAGDNVVGVLNLQNNVPGTLTEQNVPVYVTLAGQLAIAIENARLFSENRQMQARLELEIRQTVHEGWADYLNVLEHKERIGFTHDGRILYEIDEAPPAPTYNRETLTAPIQVQNAAIGGIEILAEPDQSLPEDAQELVNLVAQQVANQIENLRLLSETERYREEAEAAMQRLTHENWESFTTELDVAGYMYDQAQLRPITEADGETVEGKTAVVRRDLVVHGESIGQIEVDEAAALDEETEELLTAVTASLSAHLENLRLTEQTEKALAETRRRAEETQAINQVAELVSRQTGRQEMLTAVLEQIKRLVPIDVFLVAFYDAGLNLIEYPFVYDDGEMFQYAPTTPRPESRVMKAIHTGEIILLNRTPDEVAALTKEGMAGTLGQEQKISATLLYLPLQVGERIMGVLSVQSYTHNAFSEADVSLLSGIANYVAVALDNIRLLEETAARAEEERLVNVITQKIQRTATMDSALETAVQELGQALQTRYMQINLNLKTSEKDTPVSTVAVDI